MCGIVGFIDFRCKTTRDTLTKMTNSLIHRGPDFGGCYFDENNRSIIGLGHRRLSILDLSSHGNQPMTFLNLTIVYNGEIYNYREIKRDLEKEGYIFESNSDTEVILKAYHKWGVKAVNRFNGMFAFAVFDKDTNVLTLIRDRAGVKPLYWYHKDGLFMFSSELRSFHEHPCFRKNINSDGLSLFLQYGYIPQPHTIFLNSYKLNSGHFLSVDVAEDKLKVEKYWDIISSYNKSKIESSEHEVQLETERLLKSACEYRMVSDVPVGVFLSGGYDSSLVAAMLQSNRQDRIKTFSIGFNVQELDEARHAKKVAEYLQTDHAEYYCTEDDALRIFQRLPDILDEPFSDHSIIPTILVSELAKRQVSVSLSADGADEIFGGYDKYKKVDKYYKFFKKIPFSSPVSKSFLKIIDSNLCKGALIQNSLKRYFQLLPLMSSSCKMEAFNDFQKIYLNNELDRLTKYDLVLVETAFREMFFLNDDLSFFDKMMAIDFKTYQADNILFKVDRATMSIGLEGREPFLDYRLVEYVARLDSNLKINGQNKKYLLKKIAHKFIPKEIMDRPKMGFSPPLVEWLRGNFKPYVEHYLDESKICKQGFLDEKAILKMKKGFYQGDNSQVNKLWSVLIFQMWYERWVG